MSPIKSGKSSDLWVAMHITGLLFFCWFYYIYSLLSNFYWIHVCIYSWYYSAPLTLFSRVFHLIFKNFVYFNIYKYILEVQNDLHEFSTKTCCTCTCITVIQFLHFLYGILMALFEFPDTLTSSLVPIKPFPIPPPDPPAIEVEQFVLDRASFCDTYDSYINHLYVYPMNLRYEHQKSFAKVRTL